MSKFKPNCGHEIQRVGIFLRSDISTIRTAFKFGTKPEGVLMGCLAPENFYFEKTEKNDVFLVNFWPNRRGK